MSVDDYGIMFLLGLVVLYGTIYILTARMESRARADFNEWLLTVTQSKAGVITRKPTHGPPSKPPPPPRPPV